MLRTLLFCVLLWSGLVGLTVAQGNGTTCDRCTEMEFTSSGGIDDEYPRYLGVWKVANSYGGRPTYMCIEDCQGLIHQLVTRRTRFHFLLLWGARMP